MRLVYNSAIADCDISGVSSEEFLDWLGPKRARHLVQVLGNSNIENIVSIDTEAPYLIFMDSLKDLNISTDIDTLTIFKITLEYIILFRHSSTTEAIAEYISYFLEDDALGYNIALSTDRVFKELLAYVSNLEEDEESLIPYHWDDGLNKLYLLKV